MQNPEASSETFTDGVSGTHGSSANMGSTKHRDPNEPESASLGDKVRNIASQAQDKTGEQLRSGVTAGKMRAASALQGVAQSLLGGAEGVEDGIGGYIRQAGEQVRRAADFLENTNTRELTRRTEEYARRQPAIFLGGAFAIGLIASRFLKSSQRNSSNDTDANHGSPHSGSAPGRSGTGRQYAGAGSQASRSENELAVRSYREPQAPSPSGIRATGDLSSEGKQS